MPYSTPRSFGSQLTPKRLIVALLCTVPMIYAAGCHRRPPRPVYYDPGPSGQAGQQGGQGVAVAPAPACEVLGTWRVGGPTGATEIEVRRGERPDTFVVKERGASSGAGVATFTSGEMRVNMGAATGGIYSCRMAADCTSMTCGFNGGASPTVITKTSTSM